MPLSIVIPLVVAALAAAATGALFRPGDWYRSLARPRWTPPDLAFPLVWTALYALMTWAALRLADAALAGGEDVAAGISREMALTALCMSGSARQGAMCPRTISAVVATTAGPLICPPITLPSTRETFGVFVSQNVLCVIQRPQCSVL